MREAKRGIRSEMNRASQALEYITSCCQRVGAFSGPFDVYRFLKESAAEIAASRSSTILPDRYIEHVAYALDMVASNAFTTPPAAVASVYLATRFEYYFRIVSGKLNPDGKWTSSAAQGAAQAELNDRRLEWKRVSSVALAYRIMKLNRAHPFAKCCRSLDQSLYSIPAKVAGGKTVADIGDRIEFARLRAAHGHWGDISGEAVFYGLMTTVVFYNQASP